ncbi:MAG: flagellar basal-body rod protein FlgG [Candidatus Omnitrophica bacterium]|nr:flagellar basal-body rod protein FlgG [Candidatus Omnitrophota bacterium]
MQRALFTAATGMRAQQLNVDIISNNLANVNTTGYKKSRVDFEDLLYQIIKAPGTEAAAGVETPSGIQIGLGVRPAAIQKHFTQGIFMLTENPLDLVIEGEGFFQVATPNGDINYTRDGSFRLDSAGQVVTANGFFLEPAITIPSDTTEITIGIDGTVSVLQGGSTTPTTVGQIDIAQFPNNGGLLALGKNLFAETTASGSPTTGTPGENGLGSINSGYLEGSNVQVVEELVNLIIAQRAYESNSKAIQAADQMLQLTNSIV